MTDPPRPGKGADRAVFVLARAALESEAAPSVFVELSGRSKAARRAVASALSDSLGQEMLARIATRAGLDPELADTPEKLLRRALGREDSARERRNPIARNESFACGHCGAEVPSAPGSAVRNHCPRCLRSLHVDGPVPGDRAADCGGLMDPVSAERSGDTWRVRQRCRRCGHERVARLHPDWGVEPDRREALRALTAAADD